MINKMNELNHMGGIVSVCLYPIHDVKYCFVQYGKVYFKSEWSGIVLPLLSFRGVPNSDKEEKPSGVVYSHSLSLPIRYKPAWLDVLLRHGFVAVVTSSTGVRWVFGTKRYPLFGHCKPHIGTTPSDGEYYLLSLSAECDTEVSPLAD